MNGNLIAEIIVKSGIVFTIISAIFVVVSCFYYRARTLLWKKFTRWKYLVFFGAILFFCFVFYEGISAVISFITGVSQDQTTGVVWFSFLLSVGFLYFLASVAAYYEESGKRRERR